MMLRASQKQENLSKIGLEAALVKTTPFRTHLGGQVVAKSSQKEAKLAPKGSQDGAKWQQRGMQSSMQK